MYRCMHCDLEVEEEQLQTISSVFEYDADEVSKLMGKAVTGSMGGDTLTVCKEPCADVIRRNSTVIYTDEPFSSRKGEKNE